MTKDVLIKKIKEKADVSLSRATIEAVFDGFKEVVYDSMEDGEDVTLPGLGKFKAKTVAERSGVVKLGINKGDTWYKPEHKKPTFKLSDSFKRMFED